MNDGEIIIDAKRVIVHPNYGIQNGFDHDVALIELAEEAHLSSEVGVVCLPSR